MKNFAAQRPARSRPITPDGGPKPVGKPVGFYPVPKPERAPKRITPMKQRNASRQGHAFPKLVSTGRRAFCRRQRCVATGARTGEVVFAQSWMPETLKTWCPYVAKVVVAHLKSRGSGGADEANIVPLERMVHELQGQKGWPWLVKVCRLMAPTEIAAEQETKYLARCAAIAKNLEAR